jgi:hypothetical protein
MKNNLRTWYRSDEKASEKLLAEHLRNLNMDQRLESCCVQFLKSTKMMGLTVDSGIASARYGNG